MSRHDHHEFGHPHSFHGHYDPNQPRVPPGQPEGGQWTSGGYRALSELAELRPPHTTQDDVPEGRAGYTKYARLMPRRGLPIPQVDMPPPPSGPRRPGPDWATGVAAAGWAFFRRLWPFNGPDQQAIIAFKAREYWRYGPSFEFEQVRVLNRKEVQQVCGDLELVQKLVNEANDGRGSPGDYKSKAAFGNKVHFDLKEGLKGNDRGLEAEVSYDKQGDPTKAGKKDSIRLDIFKFIDDETICIYDLKTLNAELDERRMREIADHIFRITGKTIKRIIITEVKPGEK